MTTHDFDQPYMIYEGELPSHLRRRPARPEQQWTDEDVDEAEGFDWSSLLVIALVLALGIVIGVCATLTLRAFSSPSRSEEPAAVAPPQLQQDVFASVPGPKPMASPISAPLAAVAPRAEAHAPWASHVKPLAAHANPAPAARPLLPTRVVAAVRPAGPCDAAPTHAERLICANPSLAIRWSSITTRAFPKLAFRLSCRIIPRRRKFTCGPT